MPPTSFSCPAAITPLAFSTWRALLASVKSEIPSIHLNNAGIKALKALIPSSNRES